MDLERLSPVQLAGRLHISEQTVRDRLGLLKDVVLADAVRRRQVAASVVRDLQKLPGDIVRDFKGRIERGERVQGNDVLAVRLELEAAGRVNPLRMGGRRKRADTVPPAQAPAPAHLAAPSPGPPTASPDAAPATGIPSANRGAASGEARPATPSAPAAIPAPRHDAATAAWGRQLGEAWW